MSIAHQFVAHGKPVTRQAEPRKRDAAASEAVAGADASGQELKSVLMGTVTGMLLDRIEIMDARVESLEARLAAVTGVTPLPVTVTRAVTGEVTLGNAVTVTRNASKQRAYRARKKGKG